MEKAPPLTLPLSVFISYASKPKDEALLEEFEAHLSLLKHQGLIAPWHHRKTLAGENRQQIHDRQLETASLILLLISADFLASDECSKEMDCALKRSETKSALVIPVFLRPVDRKNAPFEHLVCLPRNGQPATSWGDTDAAFTHIVSEIRETIEQYSFSSGKQISEKERKLRALLFTTQSGFLRDRLDSFVGRKRELTELQHMINARFQTGGYVTITGQAGQGKSSIIAKLVETYDIEQTAYHFIPFNPGPDHQVNLLRNLMARLILKYDLSDLYVASENRAALRDYFPHVLLDVVNKGGKEVIFVDGLDQLEEDFNSVRDLSFLPHDPPPGIVFVLGTRPNDTMKPLELLKPIDPYPLPNLSRQDFTLILQHRQVSLDEYLADQFYRAMDENALYLDLVARELFDNKILSPQQVIAKVASNPANIFSLSIARLKQPPIEWREVIKPVLGLLLAAREPLASWHIRHILQIEDERLREALARLGGLVVDTGQRRYTLFHLKLRDYLRQEEEHDHKDYIFATDEEEGWHARLAHWCEQGDLSQIWQDVNNPKEQGRRTYARQHYITHLYFARKWQHVFKILDEGSYGRAKERCNLSTRSYIQDLDRGCQAAAHYGSTLQETIAMLPLLWRYTLLRGSLRSQADHYPLETFQLLLLLKREAEVLGLAELLTNSNYKVDVLLLMAQYLAKQTERQAESTQIFFRASEVARGIEESYQRAWALRRLASSLAEAEQWEQAKLVWTEAEAVARGTERRDKRAEALSELVSSLAKAKQWEQAETIARDIEKGDQRARALSALASSLAEAEQWEQARPLWIEAEALACDEESGLRAWILIELVSSLAKAKQWKQAEALTRDIEESDERAEALSVLANNLLAAREYKRLVSLIHASWLQVETRSDALFLFSLGLVLLSIEPEIGIAFYRGFQWVDRFLNG